jgi:hypothetical protein
LATLVEGPSDEATMSGRRRRWLWILAVTLGLAAAIGGAGWAAREQIAVWLAPAKEASRARTAAAVEADSLFWRTFHGGDYDNIQPALEALTAAYLADPRDSVTAAHIAWLHNWRGAEVARRPARPAVITDEFVLARRYFDEAVTLNPDDARTRGFRAGMMMAEGNIHQDEALIRRGYFMMMDAVDAWPEFNLFTAGFVFSRLPPSSDRFKDGLEYQWRTLDTCIGETIDRANPDYARYYRLETHTGPKRVCWNSWIAPHNLEGFFLNMGDMLVKAGDWRTGQKIYANARRIREYGRWKYRDVLDARIRDAEANVAHFNDANPPRGREIMINSAFACMACHRD